MILFKIRYLQAVAGIVFLMFFCCLTSQAIIIRHDRDDVKYLELGKKYKAICHMNLPDGEGTLVSPLWVLTAAHVASAVKPGHLLTIGNKKYPAERVIIYPSWNGTRHDIALIKLREQVFHVKPVKLYDKPDETGRMITILGRGQTGNGLTGPVKNDGKLRGATNIVEQVNKAWIIFNFDEPENATDLEGVGGPGDSGGPALFEIENDIFIAGISAFQSYNKSGVFEGEYGVIEYYTRVSSYIDWIKQTMQD